MGRCVYDMEDDIEHDEEVVVLVIMEQGGGSK